MKKYKEDQPNTISIPRTNEAGAKHEAGRCGGESVCVCWGWGLPGMGQGRGLTCQRSGIQCSDLVACALQLNSWFPKTSWRN